MPEENDMTYEAWRISFQSSEQAARAAYAEADQLRRRAEQAEHTLNEIADTLGIGKQVRTPTALLANIENATRRSRCLSMIEAHHTITVLDDDDGEEMEEQLLNWGEEPEQYIETYRAVVTPNAGSNGPSDSEGPR
jgi:hypothetical protein